MPTKEHKRHARGIVEALESRAHAGPSVASTEILSARSFLEQHDFSPASDYFRRLVQLQDRLRTRPIVDNSRRGRIKVSHRFNGAGRIDFVELKFLRSMQPCLTGEIRKLLLVQGFQSHRKAWHEAEAHVLQVLPQELVFLYPDFFRMTRVDLFAWLINIGHRTVADLLSDMRAGRVNGHVRETGGNPNQLRLAEVGADGVAVPILEQAAALEAAVEFAEPESAIVRYVGK